MSRDMGILVALLIAWSASFPAVDTSRHAEYFVTVVRELAPQFNWQDFQVALVCVQGEPLPEECR